MSDQERSAKLPKGPTLEAPPKPAPLMSDTPKKRADLEHLQHMLREDQGPTNLPEDEEEEDDEDGSTEPPKEPEPVTDASLEFGPPEWFRMPAAGLPPDVEPGTTVIFVRLPVWITGSPKRGERQCALRPLNLKLERLAQQKAKNGTNNDLVDEYCKGMICVVDGAQAQQFRAGEGSVNHFWNEIGPKGREVIRIHYVQLCMLTKKDRENFLGSCVAVRTVA